MFLAVHTVYNLLPLPLTHEDCTKRFSRHEVLQFISQYFLQVFIFLKRPFLFVPEGAVKTPADPISTFRTSLAFLVALVVILFVCGCTHAHTRQFHSPPNDNETVPWKGRKAITSVTISTSHYKINV